MLYGLFSLQTNLQISLHYQSDILQHNGTNYEQLLFSSDIGAGTSAMGICAFFYMWNLFGVVVFQRCMVNWGDVCHGYMCILLYVKLIWCSGVPEMYGWLPGGQWHSKREERERGHLCWICPYFNMGHLCWICLYFWTDIPYFYIGYPVSVSCDPEI